MSKHRRVNDAPSKACPWCSIGAAFGSYVQDCTWKEHLQFSINILDQNNNGAAPAGMVLPTVAVSLVAYMDVVSKDRDLSSGKKYVFYMPIFIFTFS